MTTTTYIQLLGTPCVGKSTIAHSLYSWLALEGYHAEYVPEYAKQLFYFGNLDNTHQSAISNFQFNTLRKFSGQVDVVVTDTHILNGLIYGDPSEKESLRAKLLRYQNQLGGLTVNIKADLNYNPRGRAQAADELLALSQFIDDEVVPLIPENQLINFQNNSLPRNNPYPQFCQSVSSLASIIDARIRIKDLYSA